MKSGGTIIAAALCVAGPLSAQEGEAFEPAFSPEDDLDCAMFVGALMAEIEAEMTPDNRTGLTSAFTYFTGRYEAQRGIDLTEAFAERYPIYQRANPAEIQQTCSVRMRAFGARLQEVNSVLSRLQPARDPDAQSEETPEE